jgi:hypothetical protein
MKVIGVEDMEGRTRWMRSMLRAEEADSVVLGGV